MSRHRVGQIAFVVLLGLGALSFARLLQVHSATWQWSLRPSATPPRITVEGRHYVRGGREPELAPGYVRLGRTMGGGQVYGPPRPHEYAVGSLDVRAGHRILAYALLGGP